MNIPKDPVMLLSFINTQLRDNYPTLEELCSSMSLDCKVLEKNLMVIDYHYDADKNQFI